MTHPDDSIFPTKPRAEGEGRVEGTPGLTKREFIAALAMQGMIAGSQGLQITTEQFAEQSLKLADALIAELNKK